MARFLLGLVAAIGTGFAVWAFTHHTSWALIAASVVAALVWFGEFILDDLL